MTLLINYLLVFFTLTIALVLLVILIWTIINGISPMPTTRCVQTKLLEELPKELHGTIIELGSGWGTLAFALAKKYPEAKVIGYETSPIPFYVSLVAKWIMRLPNVSFQKQSIYTADVTSARLITCYLYPAAMLKLKDKFEGECNVRCQIASHTFRIPGWKASHLFHADDLYKTAIYLYEMKDIDKKP